MLHKCSTTKTAEVFFLNPTRKYSLKDISEEIKIAHTSVKNNLQKLVKSKIVLESIEIQGKRKFPSYRANIDNPLFKSYKQIYNFTSIFESGIIEFIEESLMPKSVVLFGSYQKGEDTENSDIDIFVECEKEDLEIKKFEKRLKRKIQLHFKKDFLSYPKELKNNIINGLTINGFVEGYK